MGRILNTVKWREFKVGMPVISRTGVSGVISELTPIAYDARTRAQDNCLSFDWEDGRKSIDCRHNQLRRIMLREKSRRSQLKEKRLAQEKIDLELRRMQEIMERGFGRFFSTLRPDDK